jgi:hypothetical protein
MAEAAARLGLDLEEALGKTTAATRNALLNINTLAEGMKATGQTTKEQAALMEAALDKAFNGAKTKADIEAIKGKLREMGQQGILTAQQIGELEATSARAAASIASIGDASKSSAQQVSGSAGTMSNNLQWAAASADNLRDKVAGVGDAAEMAADKVRRLKEETDAAAAASQGMSAALGNMLGKGREEFEQFGEAAAQAYDRLIEQHTRMSQGVGVDTYIRTLTADVDILRRSYEGLNSSSLEKVNGQLETMNNNLREAGRLF